MTRAEAIEILKAHHMWTGEPQEIIDVRKENKALEMAIQALSQEPTFDDECQKDMDEAWEQIQKKRKRIPVTLDLTPCDDAISRKAVKQAINCWIGSGEYRYAMSERFLIDRINDLPSVNPHKSGKWIPLENRIEWGERVKCSECGQVFITGDDISRHFCPNCGARMTGGKERDYDVECRNHSDMILNAQKGGKE